ncbi:MAG: magnesium transporter CorA family protein [Alphaproteobacteria bacterium]|nr:magnesium transporter CorA family protein [Alphaproteobacteria bacterium]MBQ7659962.1 magnesium transporter CorA family protein [Alphaproteobacteria bacterium]
MLRIYKSEDGGKLVKLKKNKVTSLSWYNLIAPDEEELMKVSEQLKLDFDMLKNALDLNERSRVEFEDNVLSLIVNFPLLDDEGEFDTLPCGLFFTKRNFMTICSRDNRIISSFNKNTAKTFDTRHRGRFLLSILSKCTQFYLKYLAILNQRTEEIEYSLRKTTNNKALFDLIAVQKALVYFTTALKDNHVVLLKLLRMLRSKAFANVIAFTDDDMDALDDVIVDNKQAIEMVDMHRSILEGMMDGFASIINNNLNLVMKFLAAITIILSIPTMLASFWGMNVPVPYALNAYGFLIVIAFSIVLTILATIYFKKKGMF